ncbi:hypothetical protein BHE74_00054010 [Ensete ventricosum]|nr:hypothetical protein BHE74_00054010 [Ensete ventricosum]
MDPYALHLAVAALVGASFVAVSAYYVHRKTLGQLLEFARAVERERGRGRRGDDDDEPKRGLLRRGRYGYRRSGPGSDRRGWGSASLPDVVATALYGDEVEEEAEEEEEEEEEAAAAELDPRGFPIPVGLPRLHTVPEGTYGSLFSVFSPE